jgi:hypothetical protein
MVIKGHSRSNAAFFSKHLMKTEDNERVEVKEIRGLMAEDVKEAFLEMRMIAAGTGAKNYFYHVNINPREDERLTPEQWHVAVDTLEKNLGLEGHARFIVEHEKNGRTHQHVIFSRVNPDTMTTVSDSFNYRIHTETARELEQRFDLAPVVMPPPPERDRFKDWETFRAQETGITPAEMKADITALWQQSDGGRAFQAAIEEKGYFLAKGDRRDFVLIDPEGDIHSLARRIDGAKAADIRAKMTDLDRDSLMGAKEASAWMQVKQGEAETSGSSDARVLPQEQQLAAEQQGEATPTIVHNPKLAVLEKYAAHQQQLAHATAQEFTNQQAAVLARQGWQLPYLGTHQFEDWLQRGHDSLEEQHAAIPDLQHQREAASPNKQPQESWAEFVTRTAEPTRTDENTREPELEL